MEQKTYSFTFTTVYKKVFTAAVILCLLAALVFSVFYLLNDYHSLSEWYMNLGTCFYKQQQWEVDFFTKEVKTQGNIFAGISALVAIAGIIYLIINRKRYTATDQYFSFTYSRNTVYWYVAVVVFALVSGTWSWQSLSPAYDEVFSAVNCAEMPVFRTLTYYMLPNNHIGYNVINNVLFSWYGDFVKSGRLMSLIGYVSAMVSVFYFLSSIIKNRLFAFVALIPVALQFHTWGFAAQARSYELLLLCGWVALLAAWQYTNNNKSRHLLIGTAANCLGFILLHSYIYLYLAQLAYIFIHLLSNKKWDTKYIKHQVALTLVVFIWYTPAICFSGLEAFTDNKWVQPLVDNVWDFIPQFNSSFIRFISDCFTAGTGVVASLSYIVFISPVFLLFTKNNTNRQVGVLYLAVWGSYILYSMVLLLTPFHRTLIIHFSFTIACCAYAFYVFVNYITGYIHTDKLRATAKTILFIIPLLLYGFYQFSWNTNNVNIALYGYDVNATYKEQTNGLKQIPSGSSVSFSDEAFYFYYIAQKTDYTINKCSPTDATYYIKSEQEALPVLNKGVYKYIAGCGDDYSIYKHE